MWNHFLLNHSSHSLITSSLRPVHHSFALFPSTVTLSVSLHSPWSLAFSRRRERMANGERHFPSHSVQRCVQVTTYPLSSFSCSVIHLDYFIALFLTPRLSHFARVLHKYRGVLFVFLSLLSNIWLENDERARRAERVRRKIGLLGDSVYGSLVNPGVRGLLWR